MAAIVKFALDYTQKVPQCTRSLEKLLPKRCRLITFMRQNAHNKKINRANNKKKNKTTAT